MTLQWSVVILDLASSPGTERQQDLVAVQGVDMGSTSFRPTTSPKPTASRLVLSFPVATPDLHITELMEVWAGWRDDTTQVWSMVDPAGAPAPPFGGYIQRIDAETVEAGEKTFDCTVVDYGLLLKKTDVPGWPTFVTTIPTSASGIGYPPGGSVQDWLIGTAGSAAYNGVVRAFLGHGMRFDGVDPIFATISFDSETMPGLLNPIPGTGAVQGYFGGAGATVESVVQAIADATIFTYVLGYTGPELVVGYWMQAVIGADATRIVPQFNFRNVADTGGPADVVVATDADPTAGEVQMLAPHKHERDASDVRTIINLFGQGGDVTEVTEPRHLVFASYSDPAHQAIYPTAYQLTPGWGGGPLYDARLHTLLTAGELAQMIESRVWGAKGSIEFYVDYAVTAGQRIQVRDTNEAINRVYTVTEAEGPDATGLYRVRVGFTQLTISDVLKGGLADVLLDQEDLAYQTGTLKSRVNPTQNGAVPVELQPNGRFRNHITPTDATVPALTLQGTSFVAPGGDAPDTATAAHTFQVLPVSDYTLTPPVLYPPPGLWATHIDGRPHPNQLILGTYTADGTYPLAIVGYAITLTRVELYGTGTVQFTKNGTALGSAVASPASTPLDVAITLHPFLLPSTPPDRLGVIVTGTNASAPLYVTVWEGPA